MQNHVNERKIRRQEDEQANLTEALSAAQLREIELQNTIVELQRKLSVAESKVILSTESNRHVITPCCLLQP